MPRSTNRKAIEIPSNMWDTLDAAAMAKNVSTLYLIADWLTEAAHRHADDCTLDPSTRRRLADLPSVDPRYMHQRRVDRKQRPCGAGAPL